MNNDTSFQYPKYTRKLFVQDDETKQVESENKTTNDVNIKSESPNNTPSLNQNSIANQLYQQNPPQIPANQMSNQYYSYQNMHYTPPNNMGYINNPNNVPNQMYMYQQPMSYMQQMPQQVYQPYPMVPTQIQPPNYVELMKAMHQPQSQYMNQQVLMNGGSYNQNMLNVQKSQQVDISAKLTKRGASLDDYEDAEESSNIPYKNKKQEHHENNKTKKAKVRDSQTKHKPVISYEDTYFTPKPKSTGKVAKVSAPKVKSNSFADKYKKLIGKKENVEALESKSSDSDSAPEEIKIEKKVTLLPVVEKLNESVTTLPVIDKVETVLEPADKEESSSDDSENDEDEEQKTQFIQGTGISLESEEDIKKWQEQRRINWMLKVSNKKNLHNEILKNPENFKDSEDSEIQTFLKFQNDHNITADAQETQKNTFKEFGKIKETVRKMFQQIDKDNNNSSVTNIASMKLIKMEEEKDNLKILPFIKALGDMNKLDYTLTDNEKEKLFGPKK